MANELLLAVAAAIVTGMLGALVTVRIARKSLRWASILSPLAVVGSIAAGLTFGIHFMVIEGQSVVLLILAATMPVALVLGVGMSMKAQQVAAQSLAEIEKERRQREVEEGRRELITWLSHDLRTPLAGIKAMGEALEDGVAPDPGRYYRMIVAEAERTNEMVSSVMSLAGLQTSSEEVNHELVSLSDLASDLVGQLTPLAQARRSRLLLECDSNVDVHGDPHLLSRAMQNIVANAIQYSGEESTITVSVRSTQEGAAFEVLDQCGGLSADALSNMFHVGWRGSVARTPSAHGGGSGLGLPIVQMVAEAHQGTVSVRNDGDGCRVTVELPERR